MLGQGAADDDDFDFVLAPRNRVRPPAIASQIAPAQSVRVCKQDPRLQARAVELAQNVIELEEGDIDFVGLPMPTSNVAGATSRAARSSTRSVGRGGGTAQMGSSSGGGEAARQPARPSQAGPSRPGRRERKRAGGEASGKRFAAMVATALQPQHGERCELCCEPYARWGPHAIASAPCGHTFGECCLIQLVRHANYRSERPRCPQCRTKLNRGEQDVWRLYVANQDECSGSPGKAKARAEALAHERQVELRALEAATIRVQQAEMALASLRPSQAPTLPAGLLTRIPPLALDQSKKLAMALAPSSRAMQPAETALLSTQPPRLPSLPDVPPVLGILPPAPTPVPEQPLAPASAHSAQPPMSLPTVPQV